MGRTLEKRKRSRALKRDANEAKSILIRLEGRIRSEGLKYDADRLWTIIGRLEGWQNT